MIYVLKFYRWVLFFTQLFIVHEQHTEGTQVPVFWADKKYFITSTFLVPLFSLYPTNIWGKKSNHSF